MLGKYRMRRQAEWNAARDAEMEQRGWAIYNSHAEWIARVDTKASVLLALQGVALGVVLSLTDEYRPLSAAALANHPFKVLLFGLGVLTILVSVVLALAVVVPQLGKSVKRPQAEGFIYFGHSRHWGGDEIEKALSRSLTYELSRQIVILGKVAWEKHRNAKWSAILFVAGAALVGALVTWNNFGG